LIVMGILLAYLLASFGRQVAVAYQRHQELERIEAKQVAARAENERLKDYLDYARSEPAAEEWARAQGWAKSGEVPVIMVAPIPEVVPTPAGPSPETAPTGNRQAWWELFFGTPQEDPGGSP
jgi:cell division protein FtsB